MPRIVVINLTVRHHVVGALVEVEIGRGVFDRRLGQIYTLGLFKIATLLPHVLILVAGWEATRTTILLQIMAADYYACSLLRLNLLQLNIIVCIANVLWINWSRRSSRWLSRSRRCKYRRLRLHRLGLRWGRRRRRWLFDNNPTRLSLWLWLLKLIHHCTLPSLLLGSLSVLPVSLYLFEAVTCNTHIVGLCLVCKLHKFFLLRFPFILTRLNH